MSKDNEKIIMEEDTILENINKSISSKLKAPIVITYICVLVVYNWDILYYLFFENISAALKIKTIREEYSSLYFKRIIICIIYAIVLIIVFTILNTFLSYCLKWFYRKDKEIATEIDNHEKISLLSEQLSRSVDEIKKLKQQIENLQNVNQSLSSKNFTINISDISKKDLNDLISHLSTRPNGEKLIFSFKELIMLLKKGDEIEPDSEDKSFTYSRDYHDLIKILNDRHLLSVKRSTWNGSEYITKFELSRSFQDFLNMEI